MYLNNGELDGKRILSRTTVQSIMGNQTDTLFGDGKKHYGLAFGVVTPEGQDAGAEGSTGHLRLGRVFQHTVFRRSKRENYRNFDEADPRQYR